MSKSLTCLLAVFLVAGGFARAASAAGPAIPKDAQTLLGQTRSSARAMPNLRFAYEQRLTRRDLSGSSTDRTRIERKGDSTTVLLRGPEEDKTAQTGEYFRQGEKQSVSLNRVRFEKGQAVPGAYECLIWDQRRFYSFQDPSPEATERGDAMATRGGSMPTVAIYSRPDVALTAFATEPACQLSLVVPGDKKPFYDVMSEEGTEYRLAEEPEAVDGFPCRVLETKNQFGRYKAWIDPSHGFNLRKAAVRKGKDDLFWGRRGAEVEYDVENVTIEEIKGFFVVATIKTRFHARAEDKESEETVEIRRFNFDLEPDFGKLKPFEPDFPGGTFALLDESPGVRYQWMHGKLVPFIDEQVRKEIDDSVRSLKIKTTSESNAGKSPDNASTSPLVSSPAHKEQPPSDSDTGGPDRPSLLFRLMLLFGVLAVVFAVFSLARRFSVGRKG